MLQKQDYQLSPNKRDFPAPYQGVQLSCEELYQVAQYFERKKNIRIYVQNYMPGFPPGSSKSHNEDVAQIQRELTEDEFVGYLHTGGVSGAERAHVECLIVTKNKIIKPICGNVRADEIDVRSYKNAASTNLYLWAKKLSSPQSDGSSCASLSLVYLKQLLKDDAYQLKELSFIFPYMESYLRPSYFFIPSPQALRYSQSSEYNSFVEALVSGEEPGSFVHKGKVIAFIPIKYKLIKVQDFAKEQGNSELEQEAESLLEQLPAFRKRWLEAYEPMKLSRSLMNKLGSNRTLAYTSQRMRKIALVEQEQKQNPGLALLTEIEKESRVLTERELVACFSDSLAVLTFKNAYELGYFLNKLGELISSEQIYPIFFNHEAHLTLIRKPNAYKECLFFLSADQRQIVNHYFKQPRQFARLYPYSVYQNVVDTLDWGPVFNIPEQERVVFLDERIPREQFSPVLLAYLLRYNTIHFDRYFENKKVLATFLMEYIGRKNLIAKLPESIGSLSHIKIMFGSEEDFYDFIDEYLPSSQVFIYLAFLQDRESFLPKLHDYLSCLDKAKCSAVLLKELNDPSSDLFKRLCAERQHARVILELLNNHCDETDIADYLSSHRRFLLSAMMDEGSIHPINLYEKLQNSAAKISFFSCDTLEILSMYQHAFSNHKNQACLIEILKKLPLNARWNFLEQILGLQEENEQPFPFLSAEQMQQLLPEKPEPLLVAVPKQPSTIALHFFVPEEKEKPLQAKVPNTKELEVAPIAGPGVAGLVCDLGLFVSEQNNSKQENSLSQELMKKSDTLKSPCHFSTQ